MSDLKDLLIRHIIGLENNNSSEVLSVPVDLNDVNDFHLPDELPVLTLPHNVLLPHAVQPVSLNSQRARSLLKAVQKHKNGPGFFVAATLKDDTVDNPSRDDFYDVATVVKCLKSVVLPDGVCMAVLQSVSRVLVGDLVKDKPYFVAKVSDLPDSDYDDSTPDFKALLTSIRESADELFSLYDSAPQEVRTSIKSMPDPSMLVHFVISNVDVPISEKHAVLEAPNLLERANIVHGIVIRELQFQRLKSQIQNKARQDIDRQQREYMLQQQMKTIQDELGSAADDEVVQKYRSLAAGKLWSDQVQKVFDKELAKLSRMNTMAPDYGLQQNYLDTLVSLPWNAVSKDSLDLKKAERRLNADHYGLDKVKERILEHLAVLKLKGDLKSPILCLYGPPGVGKTSLGRSIADALGRKYVRVSLGGLHDEAEIRGHRRTYIGAMPGRIIQGLKSAGTGNPVFVLDEIDKVCQDYHGDPASALLEVLDPEQNASFHDNFLDLDYDLSQVLFIATANNTSSIPAPLLDRMELIPVDGYLLEEKVEIAVRHLLPKAMEAHGIHKSDFSISRKVLSFIIDKYTRESGVRHLDKTLATICRKVALKIARNESVDKSLSQDSVRTLLGAEKVNHDSWHDDLKAGVVTGLAWTAVGGEILFVECAASRGKGKVTLTGNLGNVMKESAVLALEYVRSNAKAFGLINLDFDAINFHIHVPEGAVPKDGPSAGITMVTSIVSALTARRVRSRLAMTGEITLRGRVTPVGGITEKILAAKRAGITDIILSCDNRNDIDEIKHDYVDGLNFHFVGQIDEVLELALEPLPSSNPPDLPLLSDSIKADAV